LDSGAALGAAKKIDLMRPEKAAEGRMTHGGAVAVRPKMIG
jgi:hypothetical protein